MESVEGKKTYDLTSKLTPFLDLHMVFPLVHFLEGKSLYKAKDLTAFQISLSEKTYMFDYLLELKQSLGQVDEATKQNVETAKSSAAELLHDFEEECGPLLDLIRNSESEVIPEDFPEYTEANLESLYHLSKHCYNSGNYAASLVMLHFYILLARAQTSHHSSNNEVKQQVFHALWGKFACEISLLQQSHDVGNVVDCLATLQELRTMIDERETGSESAPPLEILQLRSWLLHWSLFVFFKHPISESNENKAGDDRVNSDSDDKATSAKEMPGVLQNSLIELFTSPKYLQAVQMNCPWLLRYLTSAVILANAKGNRKTLRTLIRALSQEEYSYSDPVTEFARCVCVTFDFNAAQQKLLECGELVEQDVFLCGLNSQFVNNARLLLFETYCRIHTKIDIKQLALKVNMSPEDAERWVVELIRKAKLDAMIDSERGHVLMAQRSGNTYQQTIDKTKDLAFRTYQLVQTVLNN